MPTLQRQKRAYQKKFYREHANVQHAKRGTTARYNKTYYVQNAEKLKSMARDAARARYQANVEVMRDSARAQYRANPQKERAAATAQYKANPGQKNGCS